MWDYGADEFFSAPFHAAFHNNLEVQSIEFFFELLQIVENCGRTMSLLRSRSGFAFSEKKTHFPVEKKIPSMLYFRGFFNQNKRTKSRYRILEDNT